MWIGPRGKQEMFKTHLRDRAGHRCDRVRWLCYSMANCRALVFSVACPVCCVGALARGLGSCTTTPSFVLWHFESKSMVAKCEGTAATELVLGPQRFRFGAHLTEGPRPMCSGHTAPPRAGDPPGRRTAQARRVAWITEHTCAPRTLSRRM